MAPLLISQADGLHQGAFGVKSEDPTAFEIIYDPRHQRMSGTAVHGNTPFNVPFISELAHNLWQGGTAPDLVLPDFIENLVSLYPWERYQVKHRLSSELYVTMHDSVDQGFGQVNELADWVNKRRAEGPTVVLCQAGLNRSSLIATTAIMRESGMTAVESIAHVREKRSPACLCNPAFEDWLLSHDS
jgi:protein-tyrosine phosphatase